MALVIKDRVKETTTTTGTGTYTLAGAVSGFETFTANLSNSDTTYYVCTDNTDFEVGLGTFTSSGTTLARTTILASSNSNNEVNWSSGTRSIFMTYPADKAVFEDASNNINGTFVGNITGNVTGNTSGTAATVTGAAQTNITSLGTLTALTVDNVAINATTIGHTDDTDLITLADGVVTVAGEISVTTLDIGGTNVTSTAAELNVLDGIASIDTDISSVSGSDDTLASAKAIKTYVDAQVTAQDLDVTSDSGTIAIDLDSETLTIAGGTGLASSASSNTITLAVDAAQTGITSLLATDIKIGEDDQTKIDFETADTINFYAGNEKQLVLTDGALTPGTNAIVDLGTDALEFKDAYFDGTVEADAITIGGTALSEVISDTTGAMFSSNTETGVTVTYQDADNTIDVAIDAAQTAITSVVNTSLEIGRDADNRIKFGTDNQIIFEVSGGDNVIFKASGEIEASSLDISGDADIDGTLEADAITVGGTALNTVIAGVTVTNATTAAVATTVTISDNENTNEENAVVFTAGGDVDGGNIGLESDGDLTYNPSTGTVSATVFKGNIDAVDGDFDGTLEADAITVAGTALATVIAGTTVTDATNSAHVLVTDNESTNEENLITFVEGATSSTGNVGLEMDGNLTYNPSTGRLTATQLAGTLQTAAQANVTSLGTLTTLTVDNVIINGSTIGHTGDTDLMTVASGVLTVAGEVDATSLDISGDADIDGTLEADAITVNGTALNTVIADEATALAIALGQYMANTFKVITKANVTSADVIYTVAGSTTTVILGLVLGNTTTSQVTATVSLASDTGSRAGANNEANQTVELVTNAPIPAGSSLEMLAGNKVVMETTDALSVTGSGSTDVCLSIMEIT